MSDPRPGMPGDRSLPVSVLILARNEEASIGACLRSVAFARDIVVVDSGSADRTREVALELGARVVETEWPGDYGAARNRADSFASCDWVFQVDADERVSPELAGEVAAFFASGLDRQFDAARMPRMEIIFGKWVRHGGWYPQYKLRLYRTGGGAWTGRVHERYDARGPVHTFSAPIVHDSYRSVHLFVEKFNRYSSIDADSEFAAGKPFRLWKLLFTPFERFFGRYVRHGGYRDGFHGFAVAALIGLNYFLRYMKLWEKQYKAGAGPGAAPGGGGGEGR